MVELAVSPEAVAKALNKHLCGNEAPSPELVKRAFGVLSSIVKEALHEVCKARKCKPGKLMKGFHLGPRG